MKPAKRSKMPKEGEWFPIGEEVVHHCCCCKAVHKWEFRVTYDAPFLDLPKLEVRITRIDKRRKRD